MEAINHSHNVNKFNSELLLKDYIILGIIKFIVLIIGGCDAERGKLGSRMSALSRRSLGSAHIKPLSGAKDDCKSKACKIVQLLYFCFKFRVEQCCKY